MKKIIKVLSPNDTGETGAHQAGILIPRKGELLSFFPELDSSVKNPRVSLSFEDPNGKSWSFNFIYYNNKLFGGTRNEYRLTSMTKFFRENNLKSGDSLIFTHEDMSYSVNYDRMENGYKKLEDGTISIEIGSGWTVVNI